MKHGSMLRPLLPATSGSGSNRKQRNNPGNAGCSRPANFRREPGAPLIGAGQSGRFLRLDVAREVVEDRLPAGALLLDAVCRFTVEGDADCNAARTGREL